MSKQTNKLKEDVAATEKVLEPLKVCCDIDKKKQTELWHIEGASVTKNAILMPLNMPVASSVGNIRHVATAAVDKDKTKLVAKREVIVDTPIPFNVLTTNNTVVANIGRPLNVKQHDTIEMTIETHAPLSFIFTQSCLLRVVGNSSLGVISLRRNNFVSEADTVSLRIFNGSGDVFFDNGNVDWFEGRASNVEARILSVVVNSYDIESVATVPECLCPPECQIDEPPVNEPVEPPNHMPMQVFPPPPQLNADCYKGDAKVEGALNLSIEYAARVLHLESIVKYLIDIRTANHGVELSEHDQTELQILRDSATSVIDEIGREYYPLTRTFKLVADNIAQNVDSIALSSLPDLALEILSVKINDRAIEFRRIDDRIEFFGTAIFSNDNLSITYLYAPKIIDFAKPSPYNATRISLRLIGFGVVAEYCMRSGMIDEAVLWDRRYKDALLAAVRVKREFRVRQRRFR